MREILSKFRKPHKLYNKSALFHSIVHQLAGGADPYHLIEDLVRSLEGLDMIKSKSYDIMTDADKQRLRQLKEYVNKVSSKQVIDPNVTATGETYWPHKK